MRAMAQWWAAPTRRTMFARDMHARVRRQARPCQRLPWESRARVSSRPVRRQELDGCRARSTTAVKPRSRVDASRRTFCHHLHESVQCTHWPDAGPRRLNRAPSQADLALLRQVTPAGASLGETASAVPTAGWKYLASPALASTDHASLFHRGGSVWKKDFSLRMLEPPARACAVNSRRGLNFTALSRSPRLVWNAAPPRAST